MSLPLCAYWRDWPLLTLLSLDAELCTAFGRGSSSTRWKLQRGRPASPSSPKTQAVQLTRMLGFALAGLSPHPCCVRLCAERLWERLEASRAQEAPVALVSYAEFADMVICSLTRCISCSPLL